MKVKLEIIKFKNDTYGIRMKASFFEFNQWKYLMIGRLYDVEDASYLIDPIDNLNGNLHCFSSTDIDLIRRHYNKIKTSCGTLHRKYGTLHKKYKDNQPQIKKILQTEEI